MASRTTVTLVDDLDVSEAEESVSFGLEGIDYEIDLSGAHAQGLRELVAPYAAAARRTGGRRFGSTAAPRAVHRDASPGRSRTATPRSGPGRLSTA